MYSALLADNYTAGAPADRSAVGFSGGKAVIVSDGTSFPTTCQVQAQTLNGNWVSVGANIATAGISSALDLPMGQYRLHCAGGTASALSVALVRVPQ